MVIRRIWKNILQATPLDELRSGGEKKDRHIYIPRESDHFSSFNTQWEVMFWARFKKISAILCASTQNEFVFSGASPTKTCTGMKPKCVQEEHQWPNPIYSYFSTCRICTASATWSGVHWYAQDPQILATWQQDQQINTISSNRNNKQQFIQV